MYKCLIHWLEMFSFSFQIDFYVHGSYFFMANLLFDDGAKRCRACNLTMIR